MKTHQWSKRSELPHRHSQPFTIQQLVTSITQYWYWFIITFILSITCAFLINRYTIPLYGIKTSALIKSSKDVNSAVSELLYGEELFGSKTIDLESEAYLFRSYSLISRTLKDLKFNVSYFDPGHIVDQELYKESPIKLEILEPSSYVPYSYHLLLEPVDEATFNLSLGRGFSLGSLVSSDTTITSFGKKNFTFGSDHQVGGFLFKVDKLASTYPGQIIKIKLQRYDRLTRGFRSKLKVAPITPESSVLELSLEYSNPSKGMDFLNKLVENYITDELLRKNEAASKTIDFINNQIVMMSDSLSTVEGKLEDFKKSNTQITLSSEGSNYLEVGQQFDSEKNQILLNQKYLNEVLNHVNSNNIDEIIVPSSIGINDQGLNNSIQELVELQLQAQSIKESNPVLASYRQRILALKANVVENIYSLKRSNQMALDNINSRIGRLNTTLKSLPEAERQFINIQRNYNLSENLYLFLMEKKAEAGIAKASNTVDYRVIDEAQATLGPISPKPLLNYLFAMVLGLGIPSLVVMLIRMLNNKVTSKEEIQELTTIPYLGMIARNRSKVDLVENNGRSITGDSFRTIRSNLRYLLNDKSESKVFLLTSSVSSEGKSFCATNLAYVFSNFGKKVVLIDADMRKYTSYTELDAESEYGLSEYLAGLVSQEEIVKNSKFPNLSVVSSGELPPNPAELLINGRLPSLIENLKTQFDYIVVDTPPVGIIPDGLELMDSCDINIFVVRQNFSLKSYLRDAEELYQKRATKNMALLFNFVDLKNVKGYYKYYNQYSKHYTRQPKLNNTHPEKEVVSHDMKHRV